MCYALVRDKKKSIKHRETRFDIVKGELRIIAFTLEIHKDQRAMSTFQIQFTIV
jgi:hypothetical protein